MNTSSNDINDIVFLINYKMFYQLTCIINHNISSDPVELDCSNNNLVPNYLQTNTIVKILCAHFIYCCENNIVFADSINKIRTYVVNKNDNYNNHGGASESTVSSMTKTFLTKGFSQSIKSFFERQVDKERVDTNIRLGAIARKAYHKKLIESKSAKNKHKR